MKRYILHSPFNIYHFETDKWMHSVHKHTYFEIIFILKGNGIHSINGNSFPYAEGDVFLLGPEDFHYFEIEDITEFCFIRFNESFQKEYIGDDQNPRKQIIKTLLYTSSQSRGSIIQDAEEKQKLRHLLAILEGEYENQHSPYFEILRDSLMRSMMVILSRNLVGYIPFKPDTKDSLEAMLMYVRQHIYQPEELSLENLAKVFNYAPAYIGNFFKKKTGESLKQYIVKHKIKLIEARLLYSDLTIGEIADEFGYTDESHLCKQFKKYAGSSPTAFRKSN